MKPIATAREAASRADWPACLSALLAAWREVPDPALAALIDRVSARAPGEPIAGANKTAAVKLRIAAATDVDVAPILEYALTEMRTFPRAYQAAVELATSRPPDPRIATALAAMITDPPFVEFKRNAEGALQRDLVEALHGIDDPRFHGFLREASARLETRRRYIRKSKPALDALAKIAGELDDAEPPALPDLADLAREIDAELARETPKQRERGTDAGELLAAIHANPDDIGLRQVYADMLQEAGDVRGEFIALQCGRADDAPPSKRERELVATHGRKWLGEIEPIIRKQGVVFRRGFLACAREGLKYTKHAPLFASPAWSTVEELEIAIWNETATKFLGDPRWKALRKVFGLYHETLASLRGRTLPWTTLGLTYARPENWPIAADVLPDLVAIDLAHDCPALDNLRAIGVTTLATRVRHIRVRLESLSVVELLRATPAGAALELVSTYTFPGDPTGESVVLDGTRATLVHHGQKLDLRFATRVLAALPQVTAIELRAPAKARVDDAAWSSLAQVLAVHDLELARP